MSNLLEAVGAALDEERRLAAETLKTYGTEPLGVITLEAAADGMRDMHAVMCQTSRVDPRDGVRYRGVPVEELTDCSMEEVFLLLLLGKRPSQSLVDDLIEGSAERRALFDRQTATKVLEALPKGSHPMDLLGHVLKVAGACSVYRERAGKTPKEELWTLRLEDGLRLFAFLPDIIAMVNAVMTSERAAIPTTDARSYGHRLADMLLLPGDRDTVRKAIEAYLVLHLDHEGGNVSAFTGYVVGSARSTPFEAISAAMDGLAGPLHGLASQDSLAFLQGIVAHFGGVPSHDALGGYIRELRARKGIVWGYGHRVLRKMDPRARKLLALGDQLFPDCVPFLMAKRLSEVAPAVLLAEGKVANPNPNVDAVSGAFLYGLGVRDARFNTPMFAAGRIPGITAQDVINAGVGLPIVRPTSFTLGDVPELIGKGREAVRTAAARLQAVA